MYFDEWNPAKQLASGEVEEKIARGFPRHFTQVEARERGESFVVHAATGAGVHGERTWNCDEYDQQRDLASSSSTSPSSQVVEGLARGQLLERGGTFQHLPA
jgi:hypothetical protein